MGRDLIHLHDISEFGPHIHIIYVFLIDRLPSGPLISEAFMRRHISHLCFNAMSVWFSNFKTGDERIRCCWIHGKLESVASLNWTRLQSWHVTRLTLDKQYKRISPQKSNTTGIYSLHIMILNHNQNVLIIYQHTKICSLYTHFRFPACAALYQHLIEWTLFKIAHLQLHVIIVMVLILFLDN